MGEHHRGSLRLQGYNYSSVGSYFITVCTQDRKIHFEENSSLIDIIHAQWVELPETFPNIYLDEFTIMPNHVHGIIFIERRGLIHQTPNVSKGVINHAPTPQWRLMRNANVTLGKIMRHFKAKCTKLIRDQGCTEFQWQRGYYDRIIRDDIELNRIREYIQNNPLMWDTDENNLRA